MIPRRRPQGHVSCHPALRTGVLSLALLAACLCARAAPNYPITDSQRSTARQTAAAGVPLSELAPDAPERYTVKAGDTLWDISKLFLRSPWHWPELWGMNLEQIRNPHLIYPGQLLLLVRGNGRASMQLGESLEPDQTGRLSPRARITGMDLRGISAVPMHLIQPFLTDAVVLDTNELDSAPRIVAGREGRVGGARGRAGRAGALGGGARRARGAAASTSRTWCTRAARSPSARSPLWAYSLVIHARRPRTPRAVSSAKARST